jgi:acetate kinase
VGENDAVVRARSLAGLERLGIVLDPARNEAGETVISADGSAVKVLVIPTNEELEMATQAVALIDA